MKRTNYNRLRQLCGVATAILCLPFQCLFASQFPLPASGDDVIGNISYTQTRVGDTLVSIGQRNNLGLNSMIDANPSLNENWRMPTGYTLRIPAKFVLPPLPRNGVVINLPEMRLYYYPGDESVITFPIGIGKVGKTVPIGNTSIIRKAVNPTWIPTEGIRAFNKEKGIDLPHSMEPGPDNPLGPYAIYLKVPSYLIHSTIFPESIGRRASFGCIRMNETDIRQFFPLIQHGTPVAVVNIPNKVGWEGNRLLLESHRPLEEHPDANALSNIMEAVVRALPSNGVTFINWQAVSYLADLRDGVPHEIGLRIR